MGGVKAGRVIAGECAYAVIAGQDDAREGSMKSYAMALDLRDDAEVIEQYKEYHRAVWDEVLEGLRSIGISKMKIFLRGSRLFMYLETPDEFDLGARLSALYGSITARGGVGRADAGVSGARAGCKAERVVGRDGRGV